MVKIATQQNVKEVEVVSNHTSKEINKILESTKNSALEDWGSDDDIFEEIPNLPNKVVLETVIDPYPKTSSLISQQQHHLSVLKDKTVHQHKNKDMLNNKSFNSQGSTSKQNTHQGLKSHNGSAEKGPAKFPGPAGLFNLVVSIQPMNFNFMILINNKFLL